MCQYNGHDDDNFSLNGIVIFAVAFLGWFDWTYAMFKQ